MVVWVSVGAVNSLKTHANFEFVFTLHFFLFQALNFNFVGEINFHFAKGACATISKRIWKPFGKGTKAKTRDTKAKTRGNRGNAFVQF